MHLMLMLMVVVVRVVMVRHHIGRRRWSTTLLKVVQVSRSLRTASIQCVDNTGRTLVGFIFSCLRWLGRSIVARLCGIGPIVFDVLVMAVARRQMMSSWRRVMRCVSVRSMGVVVWRRRTAIVVVLWRRIIRHLTTGVIRMIIGWRRWVVSVSCDGDGMKGMVVRYNQSLHNHQQNKVLNQRQFLP
jgi:hypothetical protein